MEQQTEYSPTADPLVIAGEKFDSRIIIGTGKYPSFDSLAETIASSGAKIVTVALRRVSVDNAADRTLATIRASGVRFLPNTSGARDAREAVRLAKMARGASGRNWVKLEVTPDPASLLPDPIETMKAAEILVEDGFVVLPYINADPVLARRLEEIGCATVMPLGAPIGTNKGLTTFELLRLIIEQANVPVIVDAGIGAPSHACEAMELGADAVMVNTALATSSKPALMGAAFRSAVTAGRAAWLAGLGRISDKPVASSPEKGWIGAWAAAGRGDAGEDSLTGFLDEEKTT